MHKLFPSKNNVHYLSSKQDQFEAAYIAVREKEGRVLSDEEVQTLPYLHQQHPKHQEWKRRVSSTKKILDDVAKKRPERILDLGCGNGWFTYLLAQKSRGQLIGTDINVVELEQAARLFTSDNCHFIYGDIFSNQWPIAYFDRITLNACVQYFPDLNQLLNRLLQLLKPNGEVHFIDSPFYKETEIHAAKERTATYYEQQGVTEMTSFYHHHAWAILDNFNYKIRYQPQAFFNKMSNLIFKNTSPFPWIVITK